MHLALCSIKLGEVDQALVVGKCNLGILIASKVLT